MSLARISVRDVHALRRIVAELREADPKPGRPYMIPLDQADIAALLKVAHAGLFKRLDVPLSKDDP